MERKSHQELKMEQLKEQGKQKGQELVTDMDYFLRDKEYEAKTGSRNSIDLTPIVVETIKPVVETIKPVVETIKPEVEVKKETKIKN